MKCTRCGQAKIMSDFESGEQFCTGCGAVVQEQVVAAGLGSHQEEGTKTHSGKVTIMRHDHGVNSDISKTGRDAAGRKLPSATKNSMIRMTQWQSRVQTKNSKEKNLRIALFELEKLVDKLNLSKAVAHQASMVYRDALKHDMIKGRSILALAAAALGVACRLCETPRNLNDIANMSNVKRKDVTKCYRLLVQELDIRVPVIDPTSCVNKIGSRMDIPEYLKREATNILQAVKHRHETSGKDPMGVTSAALYIACEQHGYPITQRQLAQVAGVTDVTVRNRCKALADLLILIDKEKADKKAKSRKMGKAKV